MNILPFESIDIESIRLNPMQPAPDCGSYISEIADLADANILPQTFKLKKIDEETAEFEFLPLSSNFYSFVKDIDDHVIKYLFNNSETLFGRKVSYDTISQLYERSLKLPDKIPAFPHMTVFVTPDCVFLNKEKIEVEIEDIPIGSEVTPILRLTNLEFYRHKYRLIWEVAIIKVENNMSTNFDYLFESANSENSEIVIANSLSEYSNTADSDSSIEFETEDSDSSEE